MAGWENWNDGTLNGKGKLLKDTLNQLRGALKERSEGINRTVPVACPVVTSGEFDFLDWLNAFQDEVDLLIQGYANLTDVSKFWTESTILDSLYTSALTSGYSGVVTSITADGFDFVPDTEGELILINSTGQTEKVAYTARSESAGVYTFTVSDTLTYVYADNDSCVIRLEPPVTNPLVGRKWYYQQKQMLNKMIWAKTIAFARTDSRYSVDGGNTWIPGWVSTWASINRTLGTNGTPDFIEDVKIQFLTNATHPHTTDVYCYSETTTTYYPLSPYVNQNDYNLTVVMPIQALGALIKTNYLIGGYTSIPVSMTANTSNYIEYLIQGFLIYKFDVTGGFKYK